MFKRIFEFIQYVCFRIWPYKYLAKNDLTGNEIKGFRTTWGAKRWYKRPMKLMGMKISKAGMFINIYEITYDKDLFPDCAYPGCKNDMREMMCPNSHRKLCVDHCGEEDH